MADMTFQRARTEEQREVRRRSILDTAAAMLDEMPASEVSLNELSRRVGLAKSNVLRYFESREAVLLELLEDAARRWVGNVTTRLPEAIDPSLPATARGDQLAAVLARSLAAESVLCDLISAQPAVLEQNVSVDVVLRFKRSGRDMLAGLARTVRGHVPELGDDTEGLLLTALIVAGALWTHTRHAPSALAAYEADPALAAFRLDLPTTLESTLGTVIAGTLARA